jgi:hypothetical protein
MDNFADDLCGLILHRQAKIAVDIDNTKVVDNLVKFLFDKYCYLALI